MTVPVPRGKSDSIDALAIARAALREPDLPVAQHDEVFRELRLLVDHREDLVTERTRMQNRVRWHLHELDPELDIAARGLDRFVVLDRLTGWLTGETANVTRFRSEACFAMYAGAAPIPASSGRANRHRLARGGNRQLNAALHRIAVTQIRLDGLGRACYQRRRENGDTTKEALRALKRPLARIVFNLRKDQQTPLPELLPAAA